MTKNKNFRGQATPSVIDTVYENCNFSMNTCIDDGGVKKGVRLFPGDDTLRTFTRCNLTNCEPPPGSTLVKSNTTICGRGEEVGSENVVIDETTITAKEYADIIYGKYRDGQYVYHSPIHIPCAPPEDT